MNRKILTNFLIIAIIITALPATAGISGVSELAVKLSEDFISKKGKVLIKKRIAILNFENKSESLKKYDVGAAISSLLAKEMSQSTIFNLVEREKVENILKEIELGMSGAISPDSAAKAGKLSGAEYLIIGSVAEIGNSIIATAKLISAETGEVISVQNLSYDRDEIIARSIKHYFSAFQSKYGISVLIGNGYIFPQDSSLERGLNLGSLDVTYRFSQNIRLGLGFFFISASEIRREKQIMTQSQYPSLDRDREIWRNYNFSGSGPKLIAELAWPIFRWLNTVLRFEYMAVFTNSLQQDIADFPVWIPDNNGTLQIQGQRTLINSWATEKNIPHLFSLSLRLEFLIFKRISLQIGAGYTYSTDYTPEIYEVGGNRNWSEDIDENGTFKEYHNFNFSRNKDGERVKFNFSGGNISLGVAIHF